ncbi:NAD(P)/FAD-dependent oxidoreductase [Paenibacillus campi]|uniref:NAD(P)/FAD-dependent oxidoreductase n=1 Tax=Paenibacillus campi TaxID=3106031 RepID=UPI002AFE60A6|nr:NAD(P)/FAD-dependent oxidoreductase [Paenibacillus sp. SGZ-1014]
MEQTTDLIVIGGGPVGLFACFYSGMRKATVKVIDSMPQLGGQLAALYPEKYIYDVAGFPKVTAQELVDRLVEQMRQFPVHIQLEEKVLLVAKLEDHRFAITTDKNIHYAKAVILTGGAGAFQPRRLNLPEAQRFEGGNLHYFVSDIQRFAGKRVLITGGGDSAVDWALMLEPVAAQVILVHRRDKFRAHEHSIDKLRSSNVDIQTPWELDELHGEGTVEKVKLRHTTSGQERQIEVDEVIVNYGFVSSIGPIAEWGLAIKSGSVVVDTRMETNIPGFFAAGDIVHYSGKVKLIAAGFGEAPTAVNNAIVYINPEAKLSPGHSSNMTFA